MPWHTPDPFSGPEPIMVCVLPLPVCLGPVSVAEATVVMGEGEHGVVLEARHERVGKPLGPKGQ